MIASFVLQFEIDPPDSAWQVRAHIRQALIEAYERRKVRILPNDGEACAPRPGEHLAMHRREHAGALLWTMDWTLHVDDEWAAETHVELASDGAASEILVSRSLHSRSFRIAPAGGDLLARPRFVESIAERWKCRSGARAIATVPRRFRAADVPGFVTADLLDASRRLPIVVFSRDPFSETFIDDPDAAADQLFGFAEVVVLEDRDATFALTHALGKRLSCYEGAARIYWPAFTRDADVYQHPLFLRERARERFPEGFANAIYAELNQIASRCLGSGPVAKRVREILQTDPKNDVARRVQELEAENGRLRAALRERSTAGSRLRSEEAPTEENESFKSVRAAVAAAAERFPETLTFLRGAMDSAEKSPFRRPAKAFQALQCLHEICIARRTGRHAPVEAAFKGHGFDYRAHESGTAKGKWPEEYTVQYEGRAVSIEQHIAIGTGAPDNCLRVHFFFDEQKQRAVIAHVGRHKTNTKT